MKGLMLSGALLMTGCASVVDEGNAPLALDSHRAVSMAPGFTTEYLGPRTRLLTRDGERLDAIYLIVGLGAGETFFGRGGEGSPRLPTPIDMALMPYFVTSGLEQRGLTVTDFQRPGDDPTVFSVTATTRRGLLYHGRGRHIRRADGRLDLVLFVAPMGRYFEDGLPAAEKLFTAIDPS